MLENSWLPCAREVMALVISFCQSERVLMTSGPVCSKVHPLRLRGVRRLLLANQRKFWTSSEKLGGRSRSASKLRTSWCPRNLLRSQRKGISHGVICTTTLARWKRPLVSRRGSRNREDVS